MTDASEWCDYQSETETRHLPRWIPASKDWEIPVDEGVCGRSRMILGRIERRLPARRDSRERPAQLTH